MKKEVSDTDSEMDQEAEATFRDTRLKTKKEARAQTGTKVTGEHGLNWERPVFSGKLRYPGGYTGHITADADPPHVLDVPMKRSACLGYTAFRPGKKDIVGKPIVSLAEERGDGEAKHASMALHSRGLKNQLEEEESVKSIVKNSASDSLHDFRAQWKNVDIRERYEKAKRAIAERGQSEKLLVQIVQAKLASRVNSYAEQQIKVRKIFQAFDDNGDGVLDEGEFRECLERLNIQLNDDQIVTLFAYFDKDRVGVIEWEKFQSVTMVHNPKGGTAVLPKVICMTTKVLDAST